MLYKKIVEVFIIMGMVVTSAAMALETYTS
jgi:hypothetical protein